MLNVICMGGSGSFEKFPSETVKIPDTQTRRFELIKNPSTIPTTLARLLADRLLADYLSERGAGGFWLGRGGLLAVDCKIFRHHGGADEGGGIGTGCYRRCGRKSS